MERKILNLLLSALLLLFAPGAATAIPGFWSTLPDAGVDDPAKTIISVMTDEELLGQVLMLGYLGSEPTEEFLGWIRDWGIGGVKVFGWNTSDLERLSKGIGEMQRAAGRTPLRIPLFVATDQEGGWVRHVKGATSVTPGNMAIGASGIALDAYQSGNIIGRELAILGINMNFAPTVDVYTNPEAHVIGPRAFSSDPLETAFLSVAYYRGMENAGIISTAKHFPGHGNADQDSHGTLPIINDSFETIWENDLLPYRLLIKEGLPSIMSGHLNFPLVTENDDPTSLSPLFLKQILRERMNFRGVIITDDMMMYGVRQGDKSVPEVCEAALLAGNDMIMISRPPEIQAEVRAYLLSKMGANHELRAAIASGAERILRVKRRYLFAAGEKALLPDPGRVALELPDRDGRSFFFDLACRSTTLIRDIALPVDPGSSDKVLLVGRYTEFFAEGSERYKEAGTYLLDSSIGTAATARRIEAVAEDYDTVIYCLANERSLDVLSRLEGLGKKVAVLSVLTPIYLRETPWVQTAVAVYGTGIESFKAGFAALAGDFVPPGRLPIQLPEG